MSLPERPNPAAVGVVIFFIAIDFAVDPFWLAGSDAERGGSICRLLAGAGLADCGPATTADLARQALNGSATLALYVWLLVALLRGRPERHALQLALAASVAYAQIIDIWIAGAGTLAGLPASLPAPFLAAALLRLAGHLYLAYDAGIAILRRMRREPVGAGRGVGARDGISIGLLIFFVLVAYTVELYWLVFWRELPQRTDPLGLALQLYGRADHGYMGSVTSFEVGVESFHIIVTQPLQLWLIAAILGRRPYRHALQLAVSSYVCYSAVLYLVARHLSHEVGSQLILYLANMPWILGNLYLAADAGLAITGRFRVAPGRTAVSLAA